MASKCELCSDCSTCKPITSRQNQIICSICLYKKTGNVQRLDGSCQKLPNEQIMNVWGKIEGCDSQTCNCENGKCVSCKNKNHYIYPEFNQCYDCLQGRYIDGKYCLLCKPKEELNINNFSCQNCIERFPNCKECDDMKCNLCLPNQGLNLNSVCISCSTTAAMLQIGRFCIPKPNNCKTITENSINLTNQTITCDECTDPSAIKDDQTGSCLTSCPSGQWRDKEQCSNCSTKNCVTCTNNQCSTCQKGYVLSKNGCVTIKNCVKEYKDRGYILYNQCIECDPKFLYSKDCSTASIQCGSCQPCDETFQNYIDSNGECQICHNDCKTCTGPQDTDCKTCLYEGYTIEPFSKTQSKCQCKNIENCLFCEKNKLDIDCFKCYPGYTASTTKPIDCSLKQNSTQKCPTNYVEEGVRGMTLRNDKQLNEQKRCYCNSQDCIYCDLNDGKKCQICKDGYELKEDKTCKVCTYNYGYDKKTQKCICQDINCKKCDSQDGSICIECQAGYFFNKKKNLCDQCQSGFIYDISVNKCVCAILNCLTCNATNTVICDECQQGFVKNAVGNQCEECRNGFKFDLNVKKCVCSVPDCKTCTASSGISCEKCNSGFELDNNQQCMKCQPNYTYNDATQKCLCAISQCSECDPINGNNCLQCNQSLQFNSVKQICEKCNVNNCDTCVQNTTDQCSSCSKGYGPNTATSKCDIAIPKCIELSATDPTLCSKCALNYKLDSNSCVCNISHCNNCNSDGTTCLKCADGYIVNRDLTQCLLCNILNCSECEYTDQLNCKACIQGYKLNNIQAGQIGCKMEIENCLELETPWNRQSSKCKKCDDKYKLSSTSRECICKIDNCKDCNVGSDGRCNTCQNGFVWDSQSNMCICQIKNCEQCDTSNYNGSCTKCKSNYKLATPSQCTCTSNNCLDCDINDGSICIQCQNGFQLNSTTKQCQCSLESCKECSETYYGQCKTCNDNFILAASSQCKCNVLNCLACQKDNGKICKICQDNYVFEFSKSTCTLCDLQGCKQCKDGDSTRCQVCQDGYRSNIENKCDIKIDNCVRLNSADTTICDQCKEGFNFDSTSKICKCIFDNCTNCRIEQKGCKQCQGGFEWNQQSQICQCSLANCQVCDTTNYGQCKTCLNGYLKDGLGSACVCSSANCDKCNIVDGRLCDRCQDGYLLEAQACVKCAVSACSQCIDANSIKCHTCYHGYKLIDNGYSCGINIQHCDKLDPLDVLKCSVCEDNYVLNSIANCECKFQNCLDCNISAQDGSCSVCQQGFLWNSTSKQCECSIKNCQECDTQPNNLGTCKTCVNGYIKDSLNECICSSPQCKNCNLQNGTKCDLCDDEYVLLQQTSQCSKCLVDNCQKCLDNDPTTCQTCDNGYSSAATNKSCQINIVKCVELDTLDKRKCIKCEDGYKLNGSNSECECGVQNCDSCQIDYKDGNCLKCEVGFKWDQYIRQCICDISNCFECDKSNQNAKCKVCINGYKLNSVQSCICSASNCKQCNIQDGSKCNICEDTFILNQVDMECQKCGVKNCEQCVENSSKECKKCQNGYSIETSNSTCQISIANCIQIDDIQYDSCLKCASNYKIDQHGKCICQIDQCLHCLIDTTAQCTQCENDFHWNTSSATCQCNIPNCLSCKLLRKADNTAYATCNQCIQGYQQVDAFNCTCTATNCKSCNQTNGSLCDICSDGYILDPSSRQCTTCQANHCLDCYQDNPNKCYKCQTGYQINQKGVCDKPQDKCLVRNCSMCDSTNNQLCKTCNDLFYINQTNNRCEVCAVEHCLQCDSSNHISCKTCNNAYNLSQQNDGSFKCDKSVQTIIILPILTKEGYEIQLQFQFQLIQPVSTQIQDIMEFQISNKNNYSYSYKQTSYNLITISIKMNENCKNESITIDFISQEFKKQNNIKDNQINANLPTFIISRVIEPSEKTKLVTKVTILSAFISAVGLAILGQFFTVFSIVDVTAFIYFLFYVNVNHPLNIEEFSKLFGSFQFAFIPDFITGSLGSEYVIESPHKFMSKGIDSFFLKNASRSISFALVILGIYLILKAFSFIKMNKLQRMLIRGLKKGWENDAIIYTIWIVFTYLSVACILQLSHSASQGVISVFSYILFLFSLFGVSATPFIFAYLIYTNSEILLKPYAIKFSSLILGLKVNTYIEDDNIGQKKKQNNNKNMINNGETDIEIRRSIQRTSAMSLDEQSDLTSEIQVNKQELMQYHMICKYTNVILFVRKILFSLFIVLLHEYSYAQLTLISLLNAAIIIYYIIYKPYLRMLNNIKSVITEILFIIIQIIASTFKDDTDEYQYQNRIQIGWAYISLCLLILFIHTIDLAFQLCQSFLIFIKPLLTKQNKKTFPQFNNFSHFNKQPQLQDKTAFSSNNISAINLQNRNQPSSQVSFISNDVLDAEVALNENQQKLGDINNIKKSIRRKRTKFTDFFGIQKNANDINQANVINSNQKIVSLAELSFQATSKIQSANISFQQDASPVKLLKTKK